MNSGGKETAGTAKITCKEMCMLSLTDFKNISNERHEVVKRSCHREKDYAEEVLRQLGKKRWPKQKAENVYENKN